MKLTAISEGRTLRKGQRFAVLAAAMMALSSCGGFEGASDGPTAALSQANIYRLAAGDKLKVTVYNEPDLTGEFQVNDGGTIAFPLIGEVRASGVTVDEFRGQLIQSLQNGFVRNPRVTVDIANYRPINIIGEVRNAGQYPYRPGISVQDAIAMAGGYTYRANNSVVYLTRASGSEQITLNSKKEETPVLPGDSIRVPERYF